jgi:hypothetical protein
LFRARVRGSSNYFPSLWTELFKFSATQRCVREG